MPFPSPEDWYSVYGFMTSHVGSPRWRFVISGNMRSCLWMMIGYELKMTARSTISCPRSLRQEIVFAIPSQSGTRMNMTIDTACTKSINRFVFESSAGEKTTSTKPHMEFRYRMEQVSMPKTGLSNMSGDRDQPNLGHRLPVG